MSRDPLNPIVDLSQEEFDQVLQTIANPPAPSPALIALFRASDSELAQARKRVAEVDAILGLARMDLARSLPVFPELHDDLGF